MTYEFEYLMHLMGAASTGKEPAAPSRELNWETVFTLARQQQILPLISRALKKNPPPSCPNGLATALKYHAQTDAIIALLGEMEEAGMPCCVVKGFAAGVNYAFPAYRVSSDTDIVIDPADEERVHGFLTEHGFHVNARWENGHHAIATHPKMGILEVHVQLYDQIVEEVWFSKSGTEALIQEPRQQLTTPSGTFWTLGQTDHLIFMTLHLVKHFILCGMSLRMMTDVALAIAKHREELDMERFWRTLNALNYGTLIRTILWSMVRYCDFAPEDFPGIGLCEEAQLQLILEDLETGGWLGKNDEEARTAGWYEYNRQVLLKSKSKLQYQFYMLNWAHSFRLSTAFPGRKRLSKDYPCVLKYPVLIPFVWVHRIVFRGLPLLWGKKWTKPIIHDEAEIGKEGTARVDLFHRLEML